MQFKKITLTASALGGLISPILLSTSYAVNEKLQTREENDPIILYDNHYFTNLDDVLRYYIQKYPFVIGNKTIIGDVSRAKIDYDYGILNQNMIYDYDYDNVSPAYVKSSGQLTASFADALKNYANPIFIRERYQGVEELFLSAQEAKDDRMKNKMDLYQGFLELPNVYTDSESFKYNPLSEVDFNQLIKIFSEGLENNKIRYDTRNYQKIVDFETPGKMPSFLANTSLDFMETEMLGKTNPWPWSEDNVKEEKEEEDNVKEPKKIPQFYDHIASVNDNEERVDANNWPIQNDEKMDGNGGAWAKIHMFEKGSNWWTLEAEGGHDKGVIIESYNTKTWFTHSSENRKLILNDKEKIKSLLAPINTPAEIIVEYSSESGDANASYSSQKYNLNGTKIWEEFKVGAWNTIQDLEKIIGSQNYQMTLSTGINKVKNNPSDTEFIHHFFEDVPGSTKNNKHFFSSLDTSYFDFALEFDFIPQKEDFLINTNDKFLKYYNYQVNENGLNWGDNIYQLFDTWKEKPVFVNDLGFLEAYDLSPNDQVAFNNMTDVIEKEAKKALETMPQIIRLKNKQALQSNNKELSNQENYDLFKLTFDKANKPQLKIANQVEKDLVIELMIESLKTLMGQNYIDISIEINIKMGYTLDDLINKIFDLLIDNESLVIDIAGDKKQEKPIMWNSWSTYQQKIQTDYQKNNNECLTYVEALNIFASLANLDSDLKPAWGKISLVEENQGLTVIDVMQSELNSLFLYLSKAKKEQKNLDLEFISQNTMIKNSRFNLNNFLPFWKVQKIPETAEISEHWSISNLSNMTGGNGKYLLLVDYIFNSGLSVNSSSNIGAKGLYFETKEYEKYKDMVFETDPPLVRILYNIDGEIILGEQTIDELERESAYFYDSEEVFLYNAEALANIRYDEDHVYYETEKYGNQLVLFQISNVYTLQLDVSDKDSVRYFLEFNGLKRYLKERLEQEIIIIN